MIFSFVSPTAAFSLVRLTGVIKDNSSGEFLTGASVQLANTYLVTLSNDKGKYELKKLKEGKYEIHISFIGYETLRQTLVLQNDTNVDFMLVPKSILQEEVLVEATRANSKTPTTFSQVTKEEIAKQNLGQDLPYLLNLQPSVVTTSDAGAGVGYTGIRIRGTDGTRINTTINGIPLNDAESQISYFVDVPDLLSSVDNIQIQRGVGTSTNGAGAFGGSINIETTKLATEAYAAVASSAGSFNTFKNTLNIGSGLLKDKFSFDGRLSKVSSDGFIDRGKSELNSYYLSGGYYGKNSTLKFITFSGSEKTYQCWNGVPEAKLNGNATELLDYIERNYLSPEQAQNLIHSSNRTYNSFTYQNQTDNYLQNNYQLHFSRRIKNYWNVNAALHYTKGKGYYEEYKEGQAFSDYNLANAVIGSDTITATNLVRQKWLENDFYGMTYSVNYSKNKNFSATLGGAYNIYDGDHYGKVIWAQFNSNNTFNKRYYNDNGLKKDFNVFVKANYQLGKYLYLYADLQVRNVDYTFEGYNQNLAQEKQHAIMNFTNPKFGVTYFLSSNKSMYLSYAIAHKEPSRDDFVQSSSISQPSPEKLENLEFGYVQKNKRYTYTFNTFYMKYTNQLVLNGEINDVGAYNRTNVNSSYRLGIEWMNTIKIIKNLEWAANATWSMNKVKTFYEFVDNYDSSFQVVNEFSNTDIAFSPTWVAGSNLTYTIIKNGTISFVSKYVGTQFLDNTSNSSRSLDTYFVNDLRFNYAVHPKAMKEILFTLALNNIFNEAYESNGYTYNYISGGKLLVENFYFPQAGFNFMGGVSLKF
ncbi:MAG: TonB-dependent receptor [Bacteroidetes bacterium]|nr:TonB-dependent receptor [Bacteroidota bacterium]